MSQDNSSYRGGIVVAGTPLGNIDDASPRLRHALATADVIAAEDTRRARNLANALGIDISGHLVSNFDHNESSRVDALIKEAQRGRTVLIISDAGMPVISDPGFPGVGRGPRAPASPQPQALMVYLRAPHCSSSNVVRMQDPDSSSTSRRRQQAVTPIVISSWTTSPCLVVTLSSARMMTNLKSSTLDL